MPVLPLNTDINEDGKLKLLKIELIVYFVNLFHVTSKRESPKYLLLSRRPSQIKNKKGEETWPWIYKLIALRYVL
jgi:hypothetical protein